MVVEALTTPLNEHLESLLTTLSSGRYSPKRLATIQNAAIFYQAMVTKRMAGSMSTRQRDMHAKENYRTFTVPSFLCWWKTKCSSDPPSWLTTTLMGQSTGSDQGKGGLQTRVNPDKSHSRRTQFTRSVDTCFHSPTAATPVRGQEAIVWLMFGVFIRSII